MVADAQLSSCSKFQISQANRSDLSHLIYFMSLVIRIYQTSVRPLKINLALTQAP